ncbi:MAG: Bifunctional autolysin [Legionella sp.]
MSLRDKPQYWIGKKKQPFADASREQTRRFMDVDSQFADPVKRIQFLDLRFQGEVSAEQLDVLLKDAGVLRGKGAVFLQASKANNVNPVYLVAHALHESKDGKSKLAIENNNFFGLGANDRHAVSSGAKFADEHGWNTVEKGIIGGAEIISKQWINKSQNTLYAMRWNPMKPGHSQYATDINWANAQIDRIYPSIKKLSMADSSYQPRYILPKYR